MAKGCFDCGENYPFGLDMILPDSQWNHIFPEGKGEGGGLLCPTCICKRAAKLKDSTVVLCWIDRIDWAGERPKEWFERSYFPPTSKEG